MEWLLVLGIIFGLINESETPVWSEDLIPCEQTEIVDAVTWVEKKYIANKYLCKEGPEVVRLPSYIELLNLPPAENMPVVAVYKFLDKSKNPLYIGKAKSLSKRLASHFRQSSRSEKINKLLEVSKFIEFSLTNTELESLLHEQYLIKNYKPKFLFHLFFFQIVMQNF